MTSGKGINSEHYTFEKSIRLNVANETLTDREVTVRWSQRNAKAQVIRQEEEIINVPALTSMWLAKVELPEVNIYSEYVSYELLYNGETVSGGSVIFSYPKYFKYENPKLACRVEGNSIVVKADSYAKSIEILNAEEDLILSDNYFDMNGGEKRVEILSGKPEGITLRSVYDIR